MVADNVALRIELKENLLVLPLTLPTIQNWSCHNCSGCCKQHLIEITEAERQRIIDQKWTEADGIPQGQAVVEPHAGPFWKRRYRLAHQSDGACVFLNEQGLCRIHAKFGEAAKPLACRIYPYAFHPAGKRITVSLRFSCPSVVKNLGRTCSQNKDEIKTLAKLVVPEGSDQISAPQLNSKCSSNWDDVLRVTEVFHDFISDIDTPLIERLYRTSLIATYFEQADLRSFSGERLDELLEVLAAAASQDELPEPKLPEKLDALHFRLLVAQYVRKDTTADLGAGWWHRLKLLRAALKFASGHGVTPRLRDELAEVPFTAMDDPFGPLPRETDELLTRYLQVKIQGLHFCGRAYYDVAVAEGLQSLLLVVPAVLWIARWIALSQNRQRLMIDDIHRALAMADHQHGYSPLFGSFSFRSRVSYLSGKGGLANLLLWYGRDN